MTEGPSQCTPPPPPPPPHPSTHRLRLVAMPLNLWGVHILTHRSCWPSSWRGFMRTWTWYWRSRMSTWLWTQREGMIRWERVLASCASTVEHAILHCVYDSVNGEYVLSPRTLRRSPGTSISRGISPWLRVCSRGSSSPPSSAPNALWWELID